MSVESIIARIILNAVPYRGKRNLKGEKKKTKQKKDKL